jgi:NADPH-dependent 2,4-dienoyl-CoA reductase/sulfur reductase-like enzyme
MTNDLKTYDLLVMGGGPAGITAAMVASSFGKSVALVDSHQEIGGAGINTGTVPSKTLRETALALSGLKSRKLYGVDLSLRREVTVADFLGHEEHVKDAFHASITQRLQVLEATIYYGTCTFLDAYTIQVRLGSENPEKDPSAPGGEIQLRGEKILIATGSSPVHPDIFPFGHGEIYDSDTILKLDRIPKTLAVVGAGVIGAEYACTFRALGAEVHIVDGRDRFSRPCLHEHGAGPPGYAPRARTWRKRDFPAPAQRHLHHSRSQYGRRDRGVAQKEGRRLHRGTGELLGKCAGPDHRRPGRLSEAALSSGRSEADRRARHGTRDLNRFCG